MPPRIRRLTASLAVTWLLPLGLLLLLAAGATVGAVPIAIAALLAALPVPLYLVAVLALDRFEREPPRLLLLAFVWGATGAMILALFLHGFAKGFGASGFFLAHLAAPIFEEAAKSLVVIAIFTRKPQEFDGVVDGIVYASMSGLGFAAMENVLYYADAYGQGLTRLEATWLVRGLMSPFAHPFFTSFLGIGLGIARYTGHAAVRVAAPIFGFSAGMLLHALWNAFSGEAFLAVYGLIMVPLFATVLVIFITSLVREGRVIRQHLAAEVAAGMLTPQDARELGTLRGRIGANCRAVFTGRLRAWRCRQESQQIAADLAFLRRATAHDPDTADPDLERTYVERLRALRRETRGEPPLP